MQPRTLQQIITELNPTFDAQTKSLQQQQQLIPGQIKTEEAALGAKQTEAFDNILGGARRRGLGFAGIPLGEQARYTSTEFLPAVARLRQQGQQQAMSLQDAILGINERRDTLAQQIFQTEQDRAFQAQQAEAARRAQAAASASISPTFGVTGGVVGGTGQAQPRVVQNRPGSFAFYDSANKPITAAQFAIQTNRSIGDVLYEMAQSGDRAAESWYKILQSEAANNDNGVGYQNALRQGIQRAPQLFRGAL